MTAQQSRAKHKRTCLEVLRCLLDLLTCIHHTKGPCCRQAHAISHWGKVEVHQPVHWPMGLAKTFLKDDSCAFGYQCSSYAGPGSEVRSVWEQSKTTGPMLSPEKCTARQHRMARSTPRGSCMDPETPTLHTRPEEPGAHLDDGRVHGLAGNEQEPQPCCMQREGPAWRSSWCLRACCCPGLHRRKPSTHGWQAAQG